MTIASPTIDVLRRVLWLGAEGGSSGAVPAGSGVIAYYEDREYLVTALHVAELCGFQPLVRHSGKWNTIGWKTVATDTDNDIAILSAEGILSDPPEFVGYGEMGGLIFGQLGYALGYPGVWDRTGPRLDHIAEMKRLPMPVVALVLANHVPGNSTIYSSSYINAGFSGGAVVFPLSENKWTVAGIITHVPTVLRPVYRDGKETDETVLEHAGLVGYTTFSVVKDMLKTQAT